MTLVIELPPEIEAQLQEVAARSGRAPGDIARAALVEKLEALRSDEEGRRRRQLALIEAWDAEDARRTDDLPAPEIPRLSLKNVL